MKKEIKVEKDFVVTYNCHTDEYTVKGHDAASKGKEMRVVLF